jgi:ADP-glucose pyrophosphorylase
MGIYLLRFAVLREVLGENVQRCSAHDFGHEVLSDMLGRRTGGRMTNSIIAQGWQLQGECIHRAILSPEVWIEAEAI